MLILHKPREPWNLDDIEFNCWQQAVEQMMLHIINCHLERHDDQIPGQDQNLITFNREHFYDRELRLVYES